MKRKKEM